jgi:hypothetical protein
MRLIVSVRNDIYMFCREPSLKLEVYDKHLSFEHNL